MTRSRPKASPAVIAAMTTNAPSRVRRRIDKTPTAANDWKWTNKGETWAIETGSETVELSATNGILVREHSAKCSCLLSPRCFHLLACLSVLELADDDGTLHQSDPSDDDKDSKQKSAHSKINRQELHPSQIDAARVAWQEAAELLALGARAAGSLTQAKFLRAIHEARAVGLHRLANAGLRVIHGARQLRNNDDSFESDLFQTDLSDFFELAYRIKNGATNDDWIGTARRRYNPISSLRLQGLFSEPIVTASGHAGVVTYLMDSVGQVFSLSNVRPGETNRALEVWQTGIDLARLTVSHQQLTNKGLLIQQGTVSRDGRLGSGQSVKAITTKGEGWNAQCVRAAFEAPFEDQVQRVFEAGRRYPLDRRAGWDLVFLEGAIMGASGSDVVLSLKSDILIRLGVAIDLDKLRYRENLTLLARAPGLPIRVIGRLVPGDAGRIDALAIAPLEFGAATAEATQTGTLKDKTKAKRDGSKSKTSVRETAGPLLEISGRPSGHINLGLELIKRTELTRTERHPVVFPNATHEIDDGLTSMRRRLRGLALYGRHSLPTGRVSSLSQESQQLQETQPTAAALMQNLGTNALASSSDITGQRFPGDPTPLAEAWLASSFYTRTATQAVQEAQWRRLSEK